MNVGYKAASVTGGLKKQALKTFLPEALQQMEAQEVKEKSEKLQQPWDKQELVKESERLPCLSTLNMNVGLLA